MRISTKGRYALKLMLDLTVNNTGEYIPLKLISERQNISVKYLEQIITTLVKSGYISGLRGSKGGYKLAKRPKDCTVGMILRATEGSLAPVAYIDGSEPMPAEEADSVITDVWKELYEAINNVVDNITLEDLAERHNEKLGNFYSI